MLDQKGKLCHLNLAIRKPGFEIFCPKEDHVLHF
jgi:hypothetical protein